MNKSNDISRTYHSQNSKIRSSKIKINKGVPQGGILSPELFIWYINNLIPNITATKGLYLFADDLCARVQGKANLQLTVT